MTTLDYDRLGLNDKIRARRFKVLQLRNRGATPPEISHTLGVTYKTVQNDIRHIKQVQLHDQDLKTIREDGANFYEIKIRELSALISAITPKDRQEHTNYILGLEKLIQTYKAESMKIQGAYLGTDQAPPPIKIIFEEVAPGQKTRAKEGPDVTDQDKDDIEAEPEVDLC